ncbi:MAG: hypothetical protein ABFE02_13130, partial [Sulfuricella sp.]
MQPLFQQTATGNGHAQVKAGDRQSQHEQLKLNDRSGFVAAGLERNDQSELCPENGQGRPPDAVPHGNPD